MADEGITDRGDSLVAHIRREGISKEELLGVYDDWGKTYDNDLEHMGYGAFRPPVQKLCELYPEGQRSQVRILDVGAGTGLMGQELKNSGFVQVDALDPSEEMIAEAKNRGIYQKYILEYLTENPVPGLKQDSYDVVVGSGMIGYSHVPYTSIFEMLRLTKPGGYVILSLRENVPTLTEHKDMEPTMERLETEGKWKSLGKTIYPDYFINVKGALYAFHVL